MNEPLVQAFQGMARYRDSHPELDETQPRIYVKFRPSGLDISFLGLLDTGGHYCLLNQTVAHLLRDQLTDSLGQFWVRTAHGRLSGELYLHSITLLAEVGESVDVEATVFTPSDWHGPCFPGYAGALDRVRFAVDPLDNQFRFKAL